MKEEDLSLIKRYPIVEYLERKGIKPVRRTPSYTLYRSPLREETHPSFKVDTQKNLWIDYAEGRGGSIIDLCMRLEGCTLSEAICHLGQQTTSADETYSLPSSEPRIGFNQTSTKQASETRRLISISDTLPPHLQEYLTKVRCIDLEKAKPFLKCISYEIRGRRYQAIGFANLLGGYELRDNHSFKGTIAPKDITPIFTDKIINQIQPTCVFEGFMDFLSFLSMKEEVTNACIVLNSVSNTAKAIRYMNAQGISFIRTFLDNDDAGRRAVQEFAGAGFHVEDMSIHYKDFKDLNEFHVSRVRERQKHKGQIQAHMSVTDQNQNKEPKQVKHKIR
ncbi:toprim domain-containing protein [Hoylesella buccalis]|uniref:toprim domain-containing protein n=1 Tax=Hoylesella buccalis TaxID=28127 RepID=UPI001D08F2D6|nr:toprim domain-containing protein [Hoylesella buccalis]MCB6902892.1 toprim domain-containing protein [Hoylesella buccalis]UEA63949.1 toprim domain-containing protein [Hoylesella buccalis]UWP48758.1 toprim domain-containing protein [Hoylesella buccalis ATCC 35310]